MKLLTLGGLRVDGASYRREKPLLLLAYLLLEGPQPRRRLADLFWPGAANPMNSLAQNLIRLRPLGAITETDQRVEAHLPCDAADFRANHRAARWTEACDTYTGEFLEGLRLDLTPDLEEWLLDTRDTLGSEARAAHLTLAEHHHARAESTPAHTHAERAYRTPGAPPCPPEDLTRLWHLLGGTDHPLTLHLRRDADDLGLRLPTPTPPTPDHTLIGRHDELSTLTRLPTGSVAWISGPPGIGKTTLLRALSRHGWRLLSARGGLPLATLEPLSPHPLSSTADALNLLRDTRLKLAIDDWEDCDDTTRATLTLVARQTPGATIAITARHPPTIPTPHHLPLHSLTEHDLQDHPGAHAATGGHPTLLTAYLNGTPPDRTLDAHLRQLGDDHRRLFLALAAQDTPNLGATRAALNLSAATLAGTLDTLTREGLTTPDGSIRASTPARHLLDTHPLDTTLTHLHLARHHPRDTAWPHWLAAQRYWEASDFELVEEAGLYTAKRLAAAGQVIDAIAVLEKCAFSDNAKLILSAHELSIGLIGKVEERIIGCQESCLKNSIMADLKYRTGLYDDAKSYLKDIEEDRGYYSGYKRMLLGHISIREYDIKLAQLSYGLARSYFNVCGEQGLAHLCASLKMRIGGSKTNIADFDTLTREARAFPVQYPTVLLNYVEWCVGFNYSEASYEMILELFDEVVDRFSGIGHNLGKMSAINAKGVFLHNNKKYNEARESYRESLALSVGSGNSRLSALVSANLAELDRDEDEFNLIMMGLEFEGTEELISEIKSNILQIEEENSAH